MVFFLAILARFSLPYGKILQFLFGTHRLLILRTNLCHAVPYGFAIEFNEQNNHCLLLQGIPPPPPLPLPLGLSIIIRLSPTHVHPGRGRKNRAAFVIKNTIALVRNPSNFGHQESLKSGDKKQKHAPARPRTHVVTDPVDARKNTQRVSPLPPSLPLPPLHSTPLHPTPPHSTPRQIAKPDSQKAVRCNLCASDARGPQIALELRFPVYECECGLFVYTSRTSQLLSRSLFYPPDMLLLCLAFTLGSGRGVVWAVLLLLLLL